MWTIKRIVEPVTVGTSVFTSGYACYSDDEHGFRLRAIIEKKSRWHVWRIRQNRSGEYSLGGNDTFFSFDAAKTFMTNRPNIWGV